MTEPIGEEFMRQTRYENMGKPAQGQGLPQPPLELPWDEKAELVSLPSPLTLTCLPSICRQRSNNARRYGRIPIKSFH